jgi:hypothetical protein
MADEIKIKGVHELSKAETKTLDKVKKVEIPTKLSVKDKSEISEESKIFAEFVPKVLQALDKEVDRESKPASNSQIASSLVEELVKAVLSKKLGR